MGKSKPSRSREAEKVPPETSSQSSSWTSSIWLYGTFSLLGVLLSLATRLGGPDAAMKYQNLANWVSSHGGFVSAKLRYVDGTVKGAMLVAAQNIKSGEKILQIPRDLQISDASIRQRSDLPSHVDGIDDLSLGRSGVAAMAAWLSSQYGSFLQSPASVGIWQPWWDMFSPPFSMPFYRETREQLLLVGSFEFQEIRRSLFWYTRDFEKLTASCKTKCSKELQMMDMNTYQAVNQFILSHAAKGPGGKPHIIPIFEFLNHLPELTSDLNYEMDDNGDLVVSAKWEIPADEEITISYGRRSNPELLASFGFADPPFLEPFWSLRIFTQVLAEKYYTELDIEDMEIDVRLATPWLSSLPGDIAAPEEVANSTLHTLQWELARGKGTVPTLLSLVETVADHFISWYSKDHFISTFRDTLEENRGKNASSSVWWRSQDASSFSRQQFAARLQTLGRAKRLELVEAASEADLSDPRRLGFWNSTVVRVKMSEYLCALAYKEAVLLIREELAPSDAMTESQRTAETLRRVLETP